MNLFWEGYAGLGNAGDTYFDAFLVDLKALIGIPSVKGPAEDRAPYGRAIKEALDYYLASAEKFGFRTFRIEDKVGVVEYGSGEEDLAVFTHIDVVPVGDTEDWRFPPFAATEHEGSLYGRGTLDDKGPGLAVLYALASLKRKGFQPERRIRIVVGGDEESGMDCIAAYKANEKPPVLGFTPDGCFPVTFSEKGILVKEAALALPMLADRLELHAGEARNVEPGGAVAKLLVNKEPDGERDEGTVGLGRKRRWSLKKQDEGDRVIFRLLEEVTESLAEGEATARIRNACRLLADESGSALGIDTADAHSGALTMQATMLRYEQGLLKFTLNIRYPSSSDAGEMEAKVAEALEMQGFKPATIDSKPPIFFDPNKAFIQAMTRIYQEATNRSDPPMAISGGTYARAYPDRVVAFGALFPGEPLNAHMVDENVKLAVMKEWLTVYEKAIEQLAAGDVTP